MRTVTFFGLGRWVLVIQSPYPALRTRHFFDGSTLLRADAWLIWPPARGLLRARTVDEFVAVLGRNVTPIGEVVG
jgi:hypothetical protein